MNNIDTHDLDWRQSLLARNAEAVMDTLDRQNLAISDLESRVQKAEAKVGSLELELRTATARLNILFAQSVGHGSTQNGPLG